MNDMIIFSRLSHTVAELTQCTDSDAENFLRELFQLAYEQLESEGRVTVPGLGTFVVTGETVAFAPDAELAGAINAPFGAFEAVELPDDEPDESPEEPEAAPAGPEPAEAAGPEPEEVAGPLPEPEPEVEPEPEKALPEEEPAEEPVDEPVEEPEPAPRRFPAWLLWVAACAGCFALGWYAGRYHAAPGALAEPEMAPAEVIAEAPADSVPPAADSVAVAVADAPAVPEPVAAVVTDTITSRRFLTTMAREHYGCMEYWVYIYEANAGKLGHPDRLSAGTVVVIPPADSLGLKAGDEVKLAEAGRKAVEIYGRFN